jgi:enoyl-CoA hydratase
MIERESDGTITRLRMTSGKANTFNLEFLAALEDSVRMAENDGTRALILTASGSIFSAGVDLNALTAGGVDYIEQFLPRLDAAFRTLFLSPLPVVAAVNGHAIAGGCILNECADYRLMSAGKIGVAELLVGVAFPTLALEIIRYAVAPQHLQRVVLTGAVVPPGEAAAMGLIDEVAEPDALMSRAMEVAKQFAAVPAEAFRVTKQQLRYEVIRRAEAAEALLGSRIDAIWRAPETLETIRRYVERTVSRKANAESTASR